MKESFEQPRVLKPARSIKAAQRREERLAEARRRTVTVTLKKCGDEGVDAGMVDLYQSLGFVVKGETLGGNIELQMPRDQVEKLHQKAIDEHYRRVKGAERAAVGPDVNLVEDRTETFKPKSSRDFLGTMNLEDDPTG